MLPGACCKSSHGRNVNHAAGSLRNQIHQSRMSQPHGRHHVQPMHFGLTRDVRFEK